MGTMEQAASLTPHEKEISGGKWRDVMVQLREDYHGPGPNKPKASYNMAAPSATP
ncbi:hypothetical protein E5676_scaffold169G002810 [Cucumis melo var. makuwa]|uniref:Uncharacterized protein n=1 Tax=Cucumis melo var. makuwa TaxID=1194695 RepID=A0A5A7TDZ0_CUCMM|nr:hypothetical protein E6C27_scaffold64G002790 [Cucumis melo var. makuwa]TYK00659.1 hypothetical protein E5676_scaffold169G002810 [Cucumis melo var. makuwa]